MKNLVSASIVCCAVFLSAKQLIAQASVLDHTFGTNGIARPGFLGQCNDMVIQPDGKILMAGASSGNYPDFALVRLLSNGSPDNTFSGDGKMTHDLKGEGDVAHAVALQLDGKIVLAGYLYDPADYEKGTEFVLTRYNTNGSIDASFGSGGMVVSGTSTNGNPNPNNHDHFYDLLIQPDGKILAAGLSNNVNTSNLTLHRYLGDGSIDYAFGGGGMVTFSNSASSFAETVRIALQNDGKILVLAQTSSGCRLYRYLVNGTPDNVFGSNGIEIQAIGTIGGIAEQSDGKIIMAGSTGSFPSQAVVARYNIDGTRDDLYGYNGSSIDSITGESVFVKAIVVDNEGNTVVAGFSGGDFWAARFDHDGVQDPLFLQLTDVGSDNDRAIALAVQQDGKIVAAGNTAGAYAAVRYDMALVGMQPVAEASVHVYPNPSSGMVWLNYRDAVIPASYIVSDPAGRTVRSGNIQGKMSSIDISALPAGIYVIHFPAGNGKALKIVKQ